MTAVGIDLSLTSTGLASVQRSGRIEIHNVQSVGKKDDTLYQRNERLCSIANEVVDWARGATAPARSVNAAHLVAIEAPSYGSRFGSAHDRSGLWWLVVAALRADGLNVVMVPPQVRAKYGSGAGNSKKDVVFAHVVEQYTDLLGKPIPNDDVADAIVLAAMAARHLGFPLEPAIGFGENNLAAMGGVAWP